MWKTALLFMLIIAIRGEASAAKRKVCIIGTGPSGLIATKYTAQYPDEFEPITFEKQSDVGGMWIYTDSTTVDEHGFPVHSSLYKYLRINGPRQHFNYPDFANLTARNGSFPYHPLVREYLQNYTDYYNIRKYMQFDTHVEKVSYTRDGKWHVKTRNLNTNKTSSTLCDFFVIGSGHHVKGYVPKIPGLDGFRGRVIHSHLFRRPEEFAGQTVVVLGASLSGLDITVQISWTASKIYLSHRHIKLSSRLPENVEQVSGVVAAAGNELILSDGSRVRADALILATGYLYDFPYLDKSTGIVVEQGKYVRYLYKHLINIRHPTMAVLNLPTPGYGVILPHAQMQYFFAVHRGNLTLPSREEMLRDERLPPGKPVSKAHYMIGEVFPYYNELEAACGGPPLPKWFIPSYWLNYEALLADPEGYREKSLYIYPDSRVEFY